MDKERSSAVRGTYDDIYETWTALMPNAEKRLATYQTFPLTDMEERICCWLAMNCVALFMSKERVRPMSTIKVHGTMFVDEVNVHTRWLKLDHGAEYRRVEYTHHYEETFALEKVHEVVSEHSIAGVCLTPITEHDHCLQRLRPNQIVTMLLKRYEACRGDNEDIRGVHSARSVVKSMNLSMTNNVVRTDQRFIKQAQKLMRAATDIGASLHGMVMKALQVMITNTCFHHYWCMFRPTRFDRDYVYGHVQFRTTMYHDEVLNHFLVRQRCGFIETRWYMLCGKAVTACQTWMFPCLSCFPAYAHMCRRGQLDLDTLPNALKHVMTSTRADAIVPYWYFFDMLHIAFSIMITDERHAAKYGWGHLLATFTKVADDLSIALDQMRHEGLHKPDAMSADDWSHCLIRLEVLHHMDRVAFLSKLITAFEEGIFSICRSSIVDGRPIGANVERLRNMLIEMGLVTLQPVLPDSTVSEPPPLCTVKPSYEMPVVASFRVDMSEFPPLPQRPLRTMT